VGQAGNQQLSACYTDCKKPYLAYKIQKIPSGYSYVLLGVLGDLEQFSCFLRNLHNYRNKVNGFPVEPED